MEKDAEREAAGRMVAVRRQHEIGICAETATAKSPAPVCCATTRGRKRCDRRGHVRARQRF